MQFAPAPGLELPLEPLVASTREEEPRNVSPSGSASRPRQLFPLYPRLDPQECRGVVDGGGEAVLGAEAAGDGARRCGGSKARWRTEGARRGGRRSRAARPAARGGGQERSGRWRTGGGGCEMGMRGRREVVKRKEKRREEKKKIGRK